MPCVGSPNVRGSRSTRRSRSWSDGNVVASSGLSSQAPHSMLTTRPCSMHLRATSLMRAGDIVHCDFGTPARGEPGFVRPAVVVTSDDVLEFRTTRDRGRTLHDHETRMVERGGHHWVRCRPGAPADDHQRRPRHRDDRHAHRARRRCDRFENSSPTCSDSDPAAPIGAMPQIMAARSVDIAVTIIIVTGGPACWPSSPASTTVRYCPGMTHGEAPSWPGESALAEQS